MNRQAWSTVGPGPRGPVWRALIWGSLDPVNTQHGWRERVRLLELLVSTSGGARVHAASLFPEGHEYGPDSALGFARRSPQDAGAGERADPRLEPACVFPSPFLFPRLHFSNTSVALASGPWFFTSFTWCSASACPWSAAKRSPLNIQAGLGLGAGRDPAPPGARYHVGPGVVLTQGGAGPPPSEPAGGGGGWVAQPRFRCTHSWARCVRQLSL